MRNFLRRFIGWIDKIIIYHYLSSILVKLSEIEIWIFSPLCQDIFTGGSADMQDDFNRGLSRAPWGLKIKYLRGENLDSVKHSDESLQRLDAVRQFNEFEVLFSMLEEVLEERNPFIHGKYFMGYGNANGMRLTFKSSYLRGNGVCENIQLTPKTIRERYLNLNENYKEMLRLYLSIT
ncbi:MAG: hypothetical protein ACJKTH_01565 [Patescibacteria group bacterium UBA2163]